jgi:hypothetical protein
MALSIFDCLFSRLKEQPGQVQHQGSHKKTAGDRAYSVVTPRLWNNLPADTRSYSSIEAFKKQQDTSFYIHI